MSSATAAQRSHALDPVRTRLIERAQRDADAVVAAARTEAAAVIAQAEWKAREILDEARTLGEADAVVHSAASRVNARREARAVELAAEREVYQAVCDGVERGICALRDSPDYPAIRAALERRARAALGPDVEITHHTRGGVVGAVPGRRADLTLPAIAARAVEELSGEAALLWTV